MRSGFQRNAVVNVLEVPYLVDFIPIMHGEQQNALVERLDEAILFTQEEDCPDCSAYI
jgi:hypothetical protein